MHFSESGPRPGPDRPVIDHRPRPGHQTKAWKMCKNSPRLEAKNIGKMYKIDEIFGKSELFLGDIGHSF